MMARKYLLCLILAFGLLAGCSVNQQPPGGIQAATETRTATPSPTTAASPSPSKTPIASPTRAYQTIQSSPTATCQDNGTIELNVVPDQGFGRELPYRIYLPPCYDEYIGELPTLYLLHGLAGDDIQWINLGTDEWADELIMSGELPPFIIVMPWQRAGLDTEEAIVKGLLPHVEENYRSLPGPKWRAIGGLSRGGGWAFRLAFKYSTQFSRVGLHSPAILAGDLTALEIWLSNSNGLRKPTIWIDIGDQDSLQPAAEELVERLEELKLEHHYSRRTGDHLADYWRRNLPDYLRWYAAEWWE